MILNEQLIQDMFQQQSSKDNIQIPAQEVSLNFTVSSRSSKQQQKEPKDHKKQTQKDGNLEILNLASAELSKFHQWISQSDCKFQQNINGLSTLLSQLQSCKGQSVTQEELSILKNQLFKKDAQYLKKEDCTKCPELNRKVIELKQQLSQVEQKLQIQNKNVELLKTSKIMSEIKEDLLSKVQINLLNSQIGELNAQISNLKSEKANLERTYLFNKTKNSEIQLKMQLQKSKGLSAAKNSTNSSELMNRNHQTIVFFDPIESDIDQWIKFFQNLKNRYMNMCKKQENERMKELGRSFTKQEKIQLHSEERLFVIFSSIKQVWKNLTKIRQNTNTFLNNESNKNVFKQKLLSSDSQFLVKRQVERLNVKNNKLVRINQYLVRQKQNLQEINQQLKEQLARESQQKHQIQQEVLALAQKLGQMKDKLFQKQRQQQKIFLALEKKQFQLQFCVQQLKKQKKLVDKKKQDISFQAQIKIKQIQKKYHQIFNQSKSKDIKLRSLQLKLKKECLQRKKYYNQLQDAKGTFRLYCRIKSKNSVQMYDQAYQKSFPDKINIHDQKFTRFDKIFNKEQSSQQKIFQDFRRLVLSALDGYSLCFLSYGERGTGKTHTLLGNKDQLGIFPRFYGQIYRLIEGERQYMNLQARITCVEIKSDKIKDVFKVEKGVDKNIEIQQDGEGNIRLSNVSDIVVSQADQLDDLYKRIVNKRLANKKFQESYNSHLIISLILEVENRKTQEVYKSRVNFVNLACPQKGSTKNSPFINKSLHSLSNVLSALANKQILVPYRENKLTQILKNTLNLDSKVIFIANISPEQTCKEQTFNTIAYCSRLKGLDYPKLIQKPEALKKKSFSKINNI